MDDVVVTRPTVRRDSARLRCGRSGLGEPMEACPFERARAALQRRRTAAPPVGRLRWPLVRNRA